VFVQVIQGQVGDGVAIRAALDRWNQELAPGATGWLGSTAGVTDDGQLVAVARFESAAAARRNSDRPEQGQWWAQAAQLFTGPVTFRDSVEVDVDLRGDPDQAGFVQVMQGRSTDLARSHELMALAADVVAAFRPDVLGSLAVAHDAGEYTAIVYFTSEQEARAAERKQLPPSLSELMTERAALEVGEPVFLDLPHPWMYSAG